VDRRPVRSTCAGERRVVPHQVVLLGPRRLRRLRQEVLERLGVREAAALVLGAREEVAAAVAVAPVVVHLEVTELGLAVLAAALAVVEGDVLGAGVAGASHERRGLFLRHRHDGCLGRHRQGHHRCLGGHRRHGQGHHRCHRCHRRHRQLNRHSLRLGVGDASALRLGAEARTAVLLAKLVVVRARRPPLELWVAVGGGGQADKLRAVASKRFLLRGGLRHGHWRGHLLLHHRVARLRRRHVVAVVLERLGVREAAALVLGAREEVAAAVAVAPVVVHLAELGLAAVALGECDVLRASVFGGSDQTMAVLRLRRLVRAAPALVRGTEAHTAVLVAVLVVHLEPSTIVACEADVTRADTRAEVFVVVGPGHSALVEI